MQFAYRAQAVGVSGAASAANAQLRDGLAEFGHRGPRREQGYQAFAFSVAAAPALSMPRLT